MKLVFPWHPGLQHLSSCMVMYCKPREFYKQRHGRAWLCSWPSYPGAPVAAIWAVWWLNLPPFIYFSQIAAAHIALHHQAQKYEPEILPWAPYNTSFQSRVTFHRKRVLETLKVTPEIKTIAAKKGSRNTVEQIPNQNPKEQFGFWWKWVFWGSGSTRNTTQWQKQHSYTTPASTWSFLCFRTSASDVLSYNQETFAEGRDKQQINQAVDFQCWALSGRERPVVKGISSRRLNRKRNRSFLHWIGSKKENQSGRKERVECTEKKFK